jgi:hypothetical protein
VRTAVTAAVFITALLVSLLHVLMPLLFKVMLYRRDVCGVCSSKQTSCALVQLHNPCFGSASQHA